MPLRGVTGTMARHPARVKCCACALREVACGSEVFGVRKTDDESEVPLRGVTGNGGRAQCPFRHGKPCHLPRWGGEGRREEGRGRAVLQELPSAPAFSLPEEDPRGTFFGIFY